MIPQAIFYETIGKTNENQCTPTESKKRICGRATVAKGFPANLLRESIEKLFTLEAFRSSGAGQRRDGQGVGSLDPPDEVIKTAAKIARNA